MVEQDKMDVYCPQREKLAESRTPDQESPLPNQVSFASNHLFRNVPFLKLCVACAAVLTIALPPAIMLPRHSKPRILEIIAACRGCPKSRF